MLTVNEIFYSIQGESHARPPLCLRASHGVRPPLFMVRHVVRVQRGREEVARRGHRGGRANNCPLVEITGGEPLLQDDVYPLMEQLLARGRTVMLETGGHRPITRVPRAVVKIVDVKCPGSGEADRNDWGNLGALAPHDEVKFVIQDRPDYGCPRRDRPLQSSTRCGAVLMSPVHGVLEPRLLSEWMLADHVPQASASAAQVHLVARDARRLNRVIG